MLSNPKPSYRNSRNVCTSKTPVNTEEILPSKLKKKPNVCLLFATVLLILMRNRKKALLHFVAVIWNEGVLFPLLKVHSLIFLWRLIVLCVNTVGFQKSCEIPNINSEFCRGFGI